MSWIDGAWHRLGVFVRGERYAREQQEEVRVHLELEAQQHANDGDGAARRKFGNLTGIREGMRRAAGFGWIDHVRQDVQYALRGFRRSPGFTITVLITLALGVGANAAIFSMLDRLFFRNPPGVERPDGVRRVYLFERDPMAGGGAMRALQRFTHPEYLAMREAVGSGADFAADIPPGAFIGRDEGAPHTAFVSDNYFALLGVRPARGRFFAADEMRIDADLRVAVITHGFWERRFGRDPDVLGKTISALDKQYRVIGVAPAGFDGIDVNVAEMFVPLSAFPPTLDDGRPWYVPDINTWSPLRPLMRVRDGNNELRVLDAATIARRRVMRDPGLATNETDKLIGGPLVAARGPARATQEVYLSARLGGVTAVVLLIACANIASLLLVRASRRRREIAVRLALGVSRRRLLSQMLTESSLLAVIGSAFAVTVAHTGGLVLRKLLLPATTWAEPPLDARVVAITVLTALVVGVVAGIAPALHAMRTDVQDSLKSGAQTGSRRSPLRSSLLAAQGALAVMLLVGAGLFIRSLGNVRALPLGFDAQRMVHARVQSSRDETDSLGPRITLALSQAAARLKSVPGVRGTTIAVDMPMSGLRSGVAYVPERPTERIPTAGNHVAHDFFSVTDMPFVAGRAFTREEAENQALVIVVNQSFARAVWPGENAIGKCLMLGQRAAACSYVVGVTSDTRSYRIIESRPTLGYFAPLSASTGFYRPNVLIINADPQHAREIAVRAKAEVDELLGGAASAIVRRTSEQIEPQYRPWRLGAQLFTAFGLVALIVAAVGVYSVVSHSASQRTREVGVRVAMGAQIRDVLDLIVRDGMRAVAIGIAIGAAASLALGKLIAALLFGINTADPFVLVGAASALIAVALAASLIPAWRAARVDPMQALRAD